MVSPALEEESHQQSGESKMNELVVLDKLENKLKSPREPALFPLAALHRKELRELRDKNVGNLRKRLLAIKNIKKDEYRKKYEKELIDTLKKQEEICIFLNDDWKNVIKKINVLIERRKNLEKKYLKFNFSCENAYGSVPSLSSLVSADSKRKFFIDYELRSKEILDKEFEESYGEKFGIVMSKIDRIVEQYEEAINFGDLEMVKSLYYVMKKADKFFDGVSKIEV